MPQGTGTKDDPWLLKTPPGTSDITLYRAPEADPPALVCNAGGTELRYHLRCIEDLHAMLKAHGDWMELGNADEQKPAKEGTVEAWARSHRIIPLVAGMASARAIAAASAITCRPCSKRWAWWNWSTTHATTGSAPSDRQRGEIRSRPCDAGSPHQYGAGQHHHFEEMTFA